MKRLLALLAAALVGLGAVVTPYAVMIQPWQSDPARYPQVVSWAGCKAHVLPDPESSPASSFYSSGAHVLVVGTHEDKDIPYYAGLFILFHETGHCLQDQEGGLGDYMWDPVKWELDADRRASDLACGMGLDGRRISRDTWDWAQATFGYNGDEGHGTLDERRHQADLARACDKRPGL